MLGNGICRAPRASLVSCFSFDRRGAVGRSDVHRLWISRRRFAIVPVSLALFGVIPTARAQQCTVNPGNGGILQSGGTCVNSNPISTGFGTAVDDSNGGNVTTNGTVTANGGGTGISATTNACEARRPWAARASLVVHASLRPRARRPAGA